MNEFQKNIIAMAKQAQKERKQYIKDHRSTIKTYYNEDGTIKKQELYYGGKTC